MRDKESSLTKKIYDIYFELGFTSKPNKSVFECGILGFTEEGGIIARTLKDISSHKQMAFIMFLIAEIKYDAVLIDNYYAWNILNKKSDFFGKSEIFTRFQ